MDGKQCVHFTRSLLWHLVQKLFIDVTGVADSSCARNIRGRDLLENKFFPINSPKPRVALDLRYSAFATSNSG
jgi:hypothetical protein